MQVLADHTHHRLMHCVGRLNFTPIKHLVFEEASRVHSTLHGWPNTGSIVFKEEIFSIDTRTPALLSMLLGPVCATVSPSGVSNLDGQQRQMTNG